MYYLQGFLTNLTVDFIQIDSLETLLGSIHV